MNSGLANDQIGALLIVGVSVFCLVVWIIETKWDEYKDKQRKIANIWSRYAYLTERLKTTKNKADVIFDLSLLENEARAMGIILRPRTIKIKGVEPCTKPSFWRAVKHLFCKDE